MDLGLSDKRALVLASTKGLGRGIADALAADGATVTVSGRSGAEAAASDIAAATGATVYGVDCDLFDRAAVDLLVDAALHKMGGVDILVLNGGGPPPGPAAGFSADDWRLWFDRMVATNIHIAGRLLPAMRARGWGRLLTVASISVVEPIPILALSNGLRSALLAWSKTLAGEIAGDGVTCNLILPGRIDTDRVVAIDNSVAESSGKSVDEVKAAASAAIPVGRYGTIAEFGAVGAFLCSERASYVTGSAIRVDGGVIKTV